MKEIVILIIVGWVFSGFQINAQENKKPNILFVMSDQWRRQAMGFVNEDPVFTPNLDKFSKEAVFFENAITNRAICTPSRATIFTGQYPATHGVYGNDVRLSTESVTLGDVAKANGYQTGYIGKLHLDGKGEGHVPPERRHGYDFWIMSRHHNPFAQKYYIQNNQEPTLIKNSWEPDWITDRAIDYMDSVKNDPFCLVISYGPPHTGGGKGFEDRYQPGKRTNGEIKMGYGYAAPEKWEELYPNPEEMPRRKNVMPVVAKGNEKDESWPTLPGYFGAISSIDENFGRIIDFLKANGLFDNTIIVFTSDHGEMLGSHGRMTKSMWYEESLGIPCLISYKNRVTSAVISNPFSTVDMTPTILGLAGIDVPKCMEGTDFAPSLLGEQQKLPEMAFCSFDQGSPGAGDRAYRGVYSEKYTYVIAQKSYSEDHIKDGVVLYDKEKDPFQMNPIYRGMGYDTVINKLHSALLKHLDDTNDPFVKLQWKAGNEPKRNYYDAKTRK